jgi:hypothetical protein
MASVVLCRWISWFLALREGNRLKVFENRMLRRMLGPKREKVTGRCIRARNEKKFSGEKTTLKTEE